MANPWLIIEVNENLNKLIPAIKQIYMLHKMKKSFLQILKKYTHFGVSTIPCRFQSFKAAKTWSVDSYLSNIGVKNAIARNCFRNVFENFHFTDNQTADKSGKAYKMGIVINDLNKASQYSMSNTERQSIDEHMI